MDGMPEEVFLLLELSSHQEVQHDAVVSMQSMIRYPPKEFKQYARKMSFPGA